MGWIEFFHFLEGEVYRSQDVKLDLGFWHILDCTGGPGNGTIVWQRVGGHAVTVAGVDSENFLFAISDPDNDAAEAGAPGLVWPLGGHLPHPGDPSVHNDEVFASHDIYTVVHSPSPGGKMGLLNYPPKFNLPPGEPTPAPWPDDFTECYPSEVTLTEIEAAVIVSPIICGNGVIDPGEECDDGNTNDGDGCSSTCKIEFCGDGIVQQGLGETCDPPGQPGPGSQPGVCRQTCTYCGDGLVNNGEQCDDGNGVNTDNCKNDCTVGITCSLTPSGTTQLSRGSNLKFFAVVQNNTDQIQVLQFATKITLPNGNMYPSSGWLLGPVTKTLNPYTSDSKLLTQFIPYNAPFGTYTYRGYAGKVSPPLLYHQCQFNFTVNP